jgi:uncharacterized membrane protein
MDEELKQRSISLIIEAAENLAWAFEAFLTSVFAVLELTLRWTAHLLGRLMDWTAETGVPMAWRGVLAMVDVSVVTIQFASVAALSVAGTTASAASGGLDWTLRKLLNR